MNKDSKERVEEICKEKEFDMYQKVQIGLEKDLYINIYTNLKYNEDQMGK